MRDRADVATSGSRLRALAAVLLEEHCLALAAGLGRHHRDLCAGDELARVHRVLRALRDADRDGEAAGGLDVGLGQAVGDPACEAEGVACVAGGHDHAELLAAEAADDVETRTVLWSTSASWRSTWSPMPCPWTSLTRLKSSMSSIRTAIGSCVLLARFSSARRRSWVAVVVEARE